MTEKEKQALVTFFVASLGLAVAAQRWMKAAQQLPNVR